MTIHASNQSRMFRSIVLMGSGLALGCGGKAGVNGAEASAGSGGSATAAAGSGAGGASGGAPAGGAFSTGGAISAAGAVSAGSPSFGGAALGGATSTAGAAGAPDCAPTQWTCSAPAECSYETGWVPGACQCDPTRPAKSSDCKVGQSFVCLRTGNPAADQQLQGFQCSCVPSTSGCSQACVSAFGNKAGSYQCDAQTLPGTVLCGCAVVLLK